MAHTEAEIVRLRSSAFMPGARQRPIEDEFNGRGVTVVVKLRRHRSITNICSDLNVEHSTPAAVVARMTAYHAVPFVKYGA